MNEAHLRVGRSGKLAWFPFEVLIAVLMVIVGIDGLANPVPLIPGAGFPSVALTVSALHLAGGLAMLAGMWRLKVLWEMAGLHLLGLAVTVKTVFIVVFQGPDALKEVLVLAAVVWAVGTRFIQLVRGRLLIQIDTNGVDDDAA